MSNKIDKRRNVENTFTNVGLVMSTDEGWNTLVDNIDSYGKNLEKKYNSKFSFEDIVFTYHENVFFPLMNELDNFIVRATFRKKATGDLFLEASEHWFEMMKENKDVFADEAVIDYIYKTSKNWFVKFLMRAAKSDDIIERKKAA